MQPYPLCNCGNKISHSFIAVTLFLFVIYMPTKVEGQMGYIYVHTKALDESSAVNFHFSVTGGTTVVPSFTLNDNPAQVPVLDLGFAQNGRLWAAGRNNVLYYRDTNSTVWINTSISDVAKVDGGPNGDCFYISTSGTVFSYTGAGTITQLSTAGQFSNAAGWNDIGSGWTATPYVVNDVANIYKYSGVGTIWNVYATVTSSPAYSAYRIDVNPTNGNVYVGGNSGTSRTIREITPALSISSLGSPVADAVAYRDIAVTANGELFATALGTSWFVHKYMSGTTWQTELGSFDASNITGGAGNLLCVTMNSGGHGGAVASYPFYNILTRGYNGTNPTYIDDERVRETIGNSQLIPVEAGTYTLTETPVSGWDLQKIQLYDPTANSSSSQPDGTAIVKVAAGEVVHVVYQNGLLNAFSMTNSCENAYLETFGSGPVGTFALPAEGQTSYHYLTGNAPGEDGHYKIVNRAYPDFNTWSGAVGILDHTPGDDSLGYMYAVNAGSDRGEFFRRRFTGVTPGATYNFSAWIVDLTPIAPVNPSVSFLVLDHNTQTVLGSYFTGELTSTSQPDSWQQYGFSFVGSATDIDLVIGNNGLGGNGNDLAIDDISFSMNPVPLPITTVTNTSCNTLGSITVTYPLGNAYEYSIDSFATAPHSNPFFPDLAAGNYTTSVRYVGTINCFKTKADTIGATVCGNVWDDGNGNAINDDGALAINGVWVNAVDSATHAVIKSTLVDSSGNYNLTGLLPNTFYQIILTSADQTGNNYLAVADLPTAFVVTGTNRNGVINDKDTMGIIIVNTGSNGISNQNFGIENLPNSDEVVQSITFPSGGNITQGMATIPVSGNDVEDGNLNNSHSIVITALPVNAMMYYNDSLVVAGQQITFFDPLRLSFSGIDPVSFSVAFDYAFIDAAGKQDPTPARYTINWLEVLFVTLNRFTATAKDCNTILVNWRISTAANLNRFEIERSKDGIDFKKSGTLKYDIADVDYTFQDRVFENNVYQYRLKMIDMDAKFKYSPVALVKLSCREQSQILLYPNPAKNVINIKGLLIGDEVTVFDVMGKMIRRKRAAALQMQIDISSLANGVYHIIITDKNGMQISDLKTAKMNN